MDRRSLQKPIRNNQPRMWYSSAPGTQGSPHAIRSLCPVSHRSRLFAEPESSQDRRLLGFVSTAVIMPWPVPRVHQASFVVKSALVIRYSLSNCTPVWVSAQQRADKTENMHALLWADAASEIGCFGSWNRSPSLRINPRRYAVIRRNTQIAAASMARFGLSAGR